MGAAGVDIFLPSDMSTLPREPEVWETISVDQCCREKRLGGQQWDGVQLSPQILN